MYLETFKVCCDVVETGSFSRAASKNLPTQSTLSQQIRSLEAHCDRQFVERSQGRGFTPAMQEFVNFLREISD